MNQKGISSIVIILIIVGVLAIGGGIWYWQKQIIKENITIISPTEGEIWKNDEIKTIKWLSIKGAEKVNIYLQELWQEQNPVKVPIVENLGSLGQYDWKVSAKPIVTEGVYQIIVQSTDGYYRGISKAFKIIDNSSTSTPPVNGYSSWLKKLITEQEGGPVSNPPASLTQCEYKNQTVYYLPPRCCDIGSILYSENGSVICSPDGGFTSGGDGRCPDFFETRQNCKTIWKDSRK